MLYAFDKSMSVRPEHRPQSILELRKLIKKVNEDNLTGKIKPNFDKNINNLNKEKISIKTKTKLLNKHIRVEPQNMLIN